MRLCFYWRKYRKLNYLKRRHLRQRLQPRSLLEPKRREPFERSGRLRGISGRRLWELIVMLLHARRQDAKVYRHDQQEHEGHESCCVAVGVVAR